jgi:hypothetical protein
MELLHGGGGEDEDEPGWKVPLVSPMVEATGEMELASPPPGGERHAQSSRFIPPCVWVENDSDLRCP